MNLSYAILSCFFLSGLAGLIYEVIWVRLIEKIIGASPFAVATVLSVFMGGLALGSFLAGKRIDRIKEKRTLLSLYGKLEVAVGVYGLVLPILLVMVKPLYVFAYNGFFNEFWMYSLLAFLGCGLLLLLPTTLMGATLPILCRVDVLRLDHLSTRTGRLYGLNTVGAAFGACLAGFFLVPEYGVWGALFVAAGLNVGIGLFCVFLSRGRWFAASRKEAAQKEANARRVTGAAGEEAEPPGHVFPAQAGKWALLIFVVSGFSAMAYEVIWTRLLGLIMGPTTYSFTLVIATFIVGLALGSLIFGKAGDRVGDIFSLLVGSQAAAAILALMVSQFLGDSQFFFGKLIYAFRESFASRTAVQTGILFGFLLVPTLLLGATFPLVNKIYARSMASVGRSIGTAYALNTIGAIGGAFAAGFFLIPFLGKESGLAAVCALQLGTALVAFSAVKGREKARWHWLPVSAAGILGVFLVMHYPSWNHQLLSYGRYRDFGNMKAAFEATGWTDALLRGPEVLERYEKGREVVFYGEGIGGFTTVERLTDSLGTVKYTLLNSGKPDASSHGDRSTQTLLAHVPMLFHPAPRNVMVLGLASGMTAGEVLHYPVERLDVLEINEQVVEASEYFRPWNNDCLRDPRTRLIIQDGRNHLSLTRETYDVIISEPSNPWMAGLANLYTLEFFRTVKSRLEPNGIFVQWIHSYEMDWPTFSMVGRTFSEAFPESLLMTTLTGTGDYLLVGFKDEAGFRLGSAEKNLRYAQRSQNMSLPDPRLLYFLIVNEDLKGLFGSGPLHTDNRPRLEFRAPKLLYETDPSIEERMAKNAALSRTTRQVIESGDRAEILLDMVEFSAAAYSPLFRILDPRELDSEKRNRYEEILRDYCSRCLVEDYGVFPGDAYKQECASIQAKKIRNHLAEAPRDAPAHYSLGVALEQAGRTDEAISAFQRAVSLDPLHAKAYNNLGVVYLEKGDLVHAGDAFQRAVSIDPAHAKAYFNLAQLAMRAGDRRDAAEYLEKGLRYEENPWARKMLERIGPLD